MAGVFYPSDRKKIFGLALALLPISLSAVWAAVPPPAATVDRMTPERLGAVPDLVMPPEAAELRREDAPLLPRPAGAETIKLTIAEVQLDGVSAYELDELVPLWREQLGHEISLDDVYAIADRLTQKYRADGYVLARAYLPQQEICCGLVKLAVAEGRIGTVSLEGSLPQTNLIRVALDEIRRAPALNITTLENQILLLSDQPGTSFRVVLKPGAEGTVDVVVVGEKEPYLSGSIRFDNSGSRYLGPYMVSGTVMLYNLPALFHQTTLTVSSAIERRELGQVAFSHMLPLWRPDLTLTLEASSTRGEPGYTLATSDIDSETTQFGLRLDWQALRQRTGSLTVSAGALLRNSDTNVTGVPFSHDNIRSVFVGARYDWRDLLQGYNQAQLTVTRGLPGVWGGSHTGDADLSRNQGQADFTKAEASLMRQQRVGESWTAFGVLSAQIANGPLLSSEEFGYGGAFMGRAYDLSEMTGDSGLSALFELRYRPLDLGALGLLEPYAFADYGAVWNRDSGEGGAVIGASLGMGARLRTAHHLSLDLSLAQPLVQSDESTYANPGGPRLLFSLQAQF